MCKDSSKGTLCLSHSVVLHRCRWQIGFNLVRPVFVICVVACCNSVFLCLPGTNVHEAKRILTESGLPITAAENLDDAAMKAVAAIKK